GLCLVRDKNSTIYPESPILWASRPFLQSCLNVAVDERCQLGFGQSTHFSSVHVAVLEQHQGGNATDVELGRRLFVFINVQFANFESAAVFLGNLFQHWCNHFTGSAPLCPIIDQDRPFCF